MMYKVNTYTHDRYTQVIFTMTASFIGSIMHTHRRIQTHTASSMTDIIIRGLREYDLNIVRDVQICTPHFCRTEAASRSPEIKFQRELKIKQQITILQIWRKHFIFCHCWLDTNVLPLDITNLKQLPSLPRDHCYIFI